MATGERKENGKIAGEGQLTNRFWRLLLGMGAVPAERRGFCPFGYHWRFWGPYAFDL